MTFQLPPPIRRIVADTGIRSWVDGDSCDRDFYWDAINSLKAVLAGKSPGAEEDPKKIVRMLQVVVVDDGAFEDYIFDPQNSPPVDDDEAWLRLCEAAAWVIVQRYTREMQGA